MGRFAGQVAVITGGASGIGAATARRLTAEGAQVAILDLDKEQAVEVASKLNGLALQVDVSDPDQVRDAIAAVERDLSGIDVLVANAGTDTAGYFTETSPADWQHVLAVNLVGVMSSVHAMLHGMRARRGGSIVVMGSEAGRVGAAAGAAYSAANAGAIGFMKAIAREYARYGIRCNAVAPGPIDTPMLRTLAESGQLGARLSEAMVESTALGRSGTADEVAASIAFLASSDASYLTGHTLAVSGGLSMW